MLEKYIEGNILLWTNERQDYIVLVGGSALVYQVESGGVLKPHTSMYFMHRKLYPMTSNEFLYYLNQHGLTRKNSPSFQVHK